MWLIKAALRNPYMVATIVRLYFRDDINPNGALTMTGQLALGTLPTLPPNTLPPVVLLDPPYGRGPDELEYKLL